ncbi:MAG: hypothetical protein PHG05_03270 [Candidatus Nanoarchaeia archaeon]|nr:hypothetical protein [Candidatus Nanoarchaeia archaeon]
MILELNIIKEKKQLLEEVVNRLGLIQKETILCAYDITIEALRNHNELYYEKIKEVEEPQSSHHAQRIVDEIINELGHAPAYIFLLNFDDLSKQNKNHLFGGNYERPCVDQYLTQLNEAGRIDLKKIAKEDLAIILNNQGKIIATNVKLVGVNPQDIYPNCAEEKKLIKKFGFKTHPNARHYSSIGASYHIPDSFPLVLGEGGNIRGFYAGRIVYSTIDKEIKKVYENLRELKK